MNVINKDKVIGEVRSLARKERISILEASLLYCETNNIEIETFATFIRSFRGKKLQRSLLKDGKALNLIKKPAAKKKTRAKSK